MTATDGAVLEHLAHRNRVGPQGIGGANLNAAGTPRNCGAALLTQVLSHAGAAGERPGSDGGGVCGDKCREGAAPGNDAAGA